MAVKQEKEAQNPLILRCNRLIEAFAKSDDERDFYLDRQEGFILYVDLDKQEEELFALEKEIVKNKDRYCIIPKLTFYETKKIMEGFVNEKVYDIDTKEKLLDIIQSKEARENFLEFIYDHHSELEKWQVFYQERSRIRIIEWLRNNDFHFVFEEDIEMPKLIIEKLKKELFLPKVGKDLLAARKALVTKAKTYYSNEALNPRPKRGRPPKQAQKTEIEPQITTDIYTCVPAPLRSFLFTPDLGTTSSTFSSKFGNEDELFHRRPEDSQPESNLPPESFNQKLAALRSLSNKWIESESAKPKANLEVLESQSTNAFDEFNDDDFDDDDYTSKGKAKGLNGYKRTPVRGSKSSASPKTSASKKSKPPAKAAVSKAKANLKATKSPAKKTAKPAEKAKVSKAKPKPVKKASPKAKEKPPATNKAKKPLRSIMKLKKKAK